MGKSYSAAKGRLDSAVVRWIVGPCLVAVVLVVLALLTRRNYLFFHSLFGLFSIGVGAGIFIVAWNTRQFIDSGYLLVLGVAYLFISAVDLLHTIAHPGTGILSAYGPNLAVRLWTAARYLEALSFVAAFVFLKRRANVKLLLFVYASVFCLLLFSVFYLDVFPVCIDAGGLTLFKRISKFVIIGVLGVAMVLLLRGRAHFDRRVLRWIGLSIAATMASEAVSTLYKADLYDPFNILGHYLKIASFYMIYKALIEIGLRDPYNVLFRDLKLRGQQLRTSERRFRQFFEGEPEYCYMVSPEGTILDVNRAALEVLGYEKSELIGQPVKSLYAPQCLEKVDRLFAQWQQSGQLRNEEMVIASKGGQRRTVLLSASAVKDEDGEVTHSISVQRDITDRKRAEERLRYRLVLETALARASQCLVFGGTGELSHVLEVLGEAVGANRAYVFLLRDGGTKMDNTHEWCAPQTEPQIHNLQGLDTAALPWWMQKLRGGEDIVIEDVDALPAQAAAEKEVLQAQDIRSLLVVPLYSSDGSLAGFMGFDDTGKPRTWSEEDIRILQVVSGMIAGHLERRQSEAQIARLAKFPSENPNPVLRVARDGTIIYSNKAGSPVLEVWESQVGGVVTGQWRRAVADALQMAQNRQTELHCDERTLSLTFAPVVESGYVNVYALDITERKRAEHELRQAHDELEQRVRNRTADLTRTVDELEDEVRDRIHAEKELRQSQARLAEAQRIAHMGNWDWDIGTDKLWWSDEVFRIFGLSPQQFEATYEAFLGYIHPDDREAVEQAVDEALQERSSYAIDHRVVRPDGTERIVHERGEVTYDKNGEAVRMAGTVQDITERKGAEDALKAERKRLFSLLNVLPGYVALKSGDGTIRYANHRFLELFGAPAGRPCYTVQFGRTKPCSDCPAPGVLKDNQPRELEWTSSGERSYHTWFYPFSDVDGEAVVLELGIDVTDRKELQKQVIETSEAVRRDIGRDLHDTLGQNLTGLALLIKGLSRKVAEQLPEELSATTQIVEMVNDSVARVRSLARGLDPVGLHGDGVVAGLRDLAGNIEEVFGVSCRFSSDKPVSLDDSVATHLYYIAQEAVNNAAKHAEARNIDITLTGDGRGIALAVQDDGVGMGQRPGEVKGMGMRIMRYRAGVIGASFSVESPTSGGTVVRCFLPKDKIADKGSKAHE